jgi:hypothetical protein
MSRELPNEIKRQISTIFDITLSNDSELIAYCERQSSTIIMINRYDSINEWQSTLSFKSPETNYVDQAKKLEIIISSTYDSYEVYELYKLGPKKLIYKFKLD